MVNRGFGDFIGTKSDFENFFMDFTAKKAGVDSWNKFLNQGLQRETSREKELYKYDVSEIYKGFMTGQNALSQQGFTTDNTITRNLRDVFNRNVLSEQSELGESLADIQSRYEQTASDLRQQVSGVSTTTRDVARSAIDYLGTLTEGDLYDKYGSKLSVLAQGKGTTNYADVLSEGGFVKINSDGSFEYTDEGRLMLDEILQDRTFQDNIRQTNIKLFDAVSENWESVRSALVGDETTDVLRNKVTEARNIKNIEIARDRINANENIVNILDLNTINDAVKAPIAGGKGTITGKTYDGKEVSYNVSTINELNTAGRNLSSFYKKNDIKEGEVFKYKNNMYIKLKGARFYKIESQRLGKSNDILEI